MIKNLILKYREMILYIVFGVLTTIINFCVYFFCKNIMTVPTAPSNIIAWLLSVIFAFFTNKFFVFSNTDVTKKSFIFQLLSFTSARLLSGAIDTGIVVLFIDKLHYNEILIKIISNVFVIVFNYVASKIIIFKKNQ